MVEPREGHRLVDRYVLDARIGAGGMGVVWRAVDTVLDRVVAVKLVQIGTLSGHEADAARDRVAREARIAARLHHGNAISIFDVVEEAGERWLVMEYLPGSSLEAFVGAEPPLPVPAVAGAGVAIAAALAAAHAAGVVHRDVKPANVLVGTSGIVKLADFGISVLAGDQRLTRTGPVLGTLGYLAPEVAAGEDATAASDVFSLGATLYAAVEGRAPYLLEDVQGNPLRLLRAASEARFPPPRGAGALTELLGTLMHDDPASRPSAAEACTALAALAGPDGSTLPRAPVGGEPRHRVTPGLHALSTVVPVPSGRRRRRPLVIAGAVVGSIALVATLVGAAGSTPAGGCDTSRGDLVIGMLASLTGPAGPDGVSVRNAAQLAVDQANATCAIPGHRLLLRVADDAPGPSRALQLATGLVADQDVVAVIGPDLRGSTTARGEWKPVMGLLSGADLVQLSYDVRPELTRGDAPRDVRDRLFPSFFRMSAHDMDVGPFAARYLVERLGAARVAVVDDGTAYGRNLSTDVVATLQRAGRAPVAVEELADGDASAAVDRIAKRRPDVVFYGGEYPGAGAVATRMTAVGLQVPLFGGDAIYSANYGGNGGRDGDMMVTIGADPAVVPGIDGFLAAYRGAGHVDEPFDKTVAGYDSVRVAVAAAATVLSGRDRGPGDRAAVVAAVQAIRFDGLAGPISFDPWGDLEAPPLTVYRFQGGDFVPVAAVPFTA